MPGASAAAATAAKSKRNDDRHNGQVHDDGAQPKEEVVIPELLPWQTKVRDLYQTPAIQVGVAVLIFGNFITSAADKQVNAVPGDPAFDIFYGFEVFFAIVFGLELVWNMYGNWLTYFWRSCACGWGRTRAALLTQSCPRTGRGWNIFDFVIVVITVISMIFEDLPGISVLRLFRAFRVFRLFKRVESLKIIIEGARAPRLASFAAHVALTPTVRPTSGVGASMPGVSNAFMILGILMGIWSIIGVEFFRDYADEEFGNFARAMFTMWQVMTMDSWASGIARPLLYQAGQWSAAPFFVSFTFIAGARHARAWGGRARSHPLCTASLPQASSWRTWLSPFSSKSTSGQPPRRRMRKIRRSSARGGRRRAQRSRIAAPTCGTENWRKMT